jgi:hypothetical protein
LLCQKILHHTTCFLSYFKHNFLPPMIIVLGLFTRNLLYGSCSAKYWNTSAQ